MYTDPLLPNSKLGSNKPNSNVFGIQQCKYSNVNLEAGVWTED